MKRYLLYILLLLLNIASIAQEKFYTKSGNDFYNKQEYEKADSLYLLAIEEDATFHPALYNHGLAMYKMNQFDEAILQFSDLIIGDNDSLIADCYFNIANATLKKWYKNGAHLGLVQIKLDELSQLDPKDTDGKMEVFLLTDSLLKVQKTLLKDKKEFLDISIANYKNCLRKNSKHDDARYNLVYAYQLKPIPPKKEDEDKKEKDKKKKEKQGPTPFAIATQQKALELIEGNKFSEAYKMMLNAKAKDNTMKKYDDLLDRLEIITKIKEK